MGIEVQKTALLHGVNAATNNVTTRVKQNVENPVFGHGEEDKFDLGLTLSKKANENITKTENKETEELEKLFKETQSSQGLIGKAWNFFKNITKIGAGSNKAEKALKEYKEGKIPKEKMLKAVSGYIDGQKQCVDMVADIVSGISAFASFSLAAGLGIAAIPFTGGASIGLVMTGFAIAFGIGSGTKVLIKGTESAIGGKSYDTFGYDIATGGINGIFAPITAGIGGAAGKAVATRVGVQAIREGGEVVLKESLKGTVKGSLVKTFLTTNIRYVGGTTAKRALVLGVDMAANGAVTGGIDSTVRYLAGNEKNKSAKGLAKEAGIGTLGGFILAPVIGGGMRLVGNIIGTFTGKLETKVNTNYKKAKVAMLNNPTVENPDAEVYGKMIRIMKRAQGLVDEVNGRGNRISDDIAEHVTNLNNNINELTKTASSLGDDLASTCQQKSNLIKEQLKKFAAQESPSPEINQLAQKWLDLAEALENKAANAYPKIKQNTVRIQETTCKLSDKAISGIDATASTLEKASQLIDEAIEQVQKLESTEAYQALGSLPQKGKMLFKSWKSDSAALEEMKRKIRAKILHGDFSGLSDDIARYAEAVKRTSIKVDGQVASIQGAAERSGIEESAEILNERIRRLCSTIEFQNLTKEQQLQAVAETANICFAKCAQTFSTNDGLPAEVTKFFKQFTSNCTVSRTLPQAQSLADELYGAGKYKLLKSFGAGTIGETYLAQAADGSEVVIKMLKEGVTPEKFAQDRAMFTKYIREFIEDKTEREYRSNLINSMFDAWDREIDFAVEAQSAKDLVSGAQRFNVSQTLEIGSKNGRNISLVMEKAKGIQLDKLLEMINLYRQNPTEYMTKYAKQIAETPELGNPENWMGELHRTYQRAQNEQIMFIGQNGTRTIHADPHPGNIFIDFDPTSAKPRITYIDAGNVIQRTQAETLDDIALALNMMIGNSEGISKSVLRGATFPSGADKKALTRRFEELLNERIFKSGVNVRNSKYLQYTMKSIMQELNIIPDSSNSNLMKATLQRMETSNAICRACGTTSSKKMDIQDLAQGLLKSFKANPKETLGAIYPILTWAYKNNDQAMLTFFQMILKQTKQTKQAKAA